jgi:hypothetical protein
LNLISVTADYALRAAVLLLIESPRPLPVEPPASFWDGWMTGFEAAALSKRPGWQG